MISCIIDMNFVSPFVPIEEGIETVEPFGNELDN
jgi:hypothetical protein